MHPEFTVDTQLFRELGELLVGRNSTALTELIKNAYDADARLVRVIATKLGQPDRGSIVIADDGHGISGAEFQGSFLRIGARTKQLGTRRSRYFRRRFTGEKGIGRLAAHKLAKWLEIESCTGSSLGATATAALSATIRWDLIEEAETLSDIPERALRAAEHEPSKRDLVGTTITLKMLRSRWTDSEIAHFVSEVHATRPPPVLVDEYLNTFGFKEDLLFSQPLITSRASPGADVDPGFVVRLLGDLEIGEQYWQILARQAVQIIEIDVSHGILRFGIRPTKWATKELREVGDKRYTRKDAQLAKGLTFQTRILVTPGALPTSDRALKEFARASYGIRIYQEGFRVLPYGEPGDDWLMLDRQYAARFSPSDPIADALLPSAREDWDLYPLPQRSYYGAVFLTRASSGLEMLVNREGFVPTDEFHRIRDIIRSGLSLAQRIRASVKAREKTPTGPKGEPPAGAAPKPERTAVARMENMLEKTRESLERAKNELVIGKHNAALAHVQASHEFLERMPLPEVHDELAMVRVLASLGSQMASFVHEINGLLALAHRIEELMNVASESATSKAFSGALRAIVELRRSLERQVAYFSAVFRPDARRRRSKQSYLERTQQTITLFGTALRNRKIDVVMEIPSDLRSPKMFASELLAILSNLISNAVKNAGTPGRIRITATLEDSGPQLAIENTGERVDLRNSEQLFEPFVSSTGDVEPQLGHGMGLGLTITKRLVGEYGGTVSFTRPSRGYATRVEVHFQEGK